jgi:hypothetical protein
MANDIEIRILGKNEAKAPLADAKADVLSFGDIAKGVFAGNLMTEAFNTFLGGIKAVGEAFVGVFKDMGDAVLGWITAAADAQLVGVQTDAVLRSTAGAAGMTKDALNELAAAFMNETTFEDDAILSAENVLLRYTSIGKDIFPQATQAVLDMATAMSGGAIPTGESLASTAVLIGKALDGDTAILTGLQRAGVVFNDTEKEMIAGLIAAGREADAQKIILGKLDEKFGGSAVMVGTTVLGAVERLRVGWGELGEDAGKVLLPAIGKFLNTTVEAFTSPQLQNAWMVFVDGIKAIIDPIFGRLATQFQGVAVTIRNGIARGDWGSAIDAMLSFLVGPGGVVPSVSGIISTFIQRISSALTAAWPNIERTLSPWATKFWAWVEQAKTSAGSYISTLVNWIGQKISAAVSSSAFQTTLHNIGVNILNGIMSAVGGTGILGPAGQLLNITTGSSSSGGGGGSGGLGMTPSETAQQQNISSWIAGFNQTYGTAQTQMHAYYRDKLRAANVPGYQHGGVVPGPLGSPQMAVVHGGERVIPNSNNYYINAYYRYQSEASLRDDIRLLQRLGATV